MSDALQFGILLFFTAGDRFRAFGENSITQYSRCIRGRFDYPYTHAPEAGHQTVRPKQSVTRICLLSTSRSKEWLSTFVKLANTEFRFLRMLSLRLKCRCHTATCEFKNRRFFGFLFGSWQTKIRPASAGI
jgi:hypothetical protein